MFFLPHRSLWLLLGFAGSCWVLHAVYQKTKESARIRRRERELGCGQVKTLPSWEPLLHLDMLIELIRETNRHTLLDATKHMFEDFKVWTVKYRILREEVCYTADPENVKAVLSLHFKSFEIGQEREKVFGTFLGKGIFMSDGEAWRHSRNMLRPSFAKSELADFETFEPHVQALIDNIQTGTPVDLQPLFSAFTFDVATEFLLGHSTNCLTKGSKAPDGVAFVKAFDRCQAALSGKGSLGAFGILLPSWASSWGFWRDIKIIRAFVDGFVEQYMNASAEEKGSEHDKLFLHRLMAETSDKVTIRSEVLNILLAARDSTASALTNIWFCISRYPAVCHRLRAEIASFDGKAPKVAELQDLKYLKAFINETLRLYPVVPENGKIAQEDATLPHGGGPNGDLPVFVPKGCVVNWSIYTMHRRKDIFGEDADDFRPERWLDAENETPLRPGWGFLPFHGGPRVCIGQQFAMIELAYTTVRMLQAFSKVEARDDRPWEESHLLVTSNLHGCKVELSR